MPELSDYPPTKRIRETLQEMKRVNNPNFLPLPPPAKFEFPEMTEEQGLGDVDMVVGQKMDVAVTIRHDGNPTAASWKPAKFWYETGC